MEQADFIHLVRESEIESANNSASYRRSVIWFAVLGYAWVVGCLLLALGIGIWIVTNALHGRFYTAYVWLSIFAIGLLWTSLRALWSAPVSEPEGILITEKQAPELFKALERIRRKVKGPAIDAVYLQDDFNAAIWQRPRFGMLGGSVNYLMIGLPLLMGLDKARVMAVLAHEYGHLRENHNRLSAWVYRSRRAWLKLYFSMRDDTSPMAMATRSFLNWYFPRFAAKSFAMARQDEYEADRIAAQMLGADVAAATLTEVEIKSLWLDEEFWRQHWAGAALHPLPQGPYSAMQAMLRLKPESAFAHHALRRVVARISDVDDTHPALRDRVEAITGARPTLPSWSTRSAMGLLGPQAAQWLQEFDNRWSKENASTWKQHHARLSRRQARVRELESSLPQHSAGESLELAALLRKLNSDATVHHLYEQILARDPHHAEALSQLVTVLPSTEGAARQKYLNTLWDISPTYQRFAAEQMVQQLEDQARHCSYDAQALRLWRDRVRQATQAQAGVLEQIREAPLFRNTSHHDLNTYELTELQAELALFRPITQAWLLNKHEASLPGLRLHLLLVQSPALGEAEREHLRAALQSHLDLPGWSLVCSVGVGEHATEEEVRRHAREPIYSAHYR